MHSIMQCGMISHNTVAEKEVGIMKKMTCREVCRGIVDFAEGTFPIEKEEELIHHIRNCPSCREELSVVLNLRMALDALDDNVDFVYVEPEESIQRALDNAKQRILNYNRYRMVKTALTTAAGWAVIITLFLQLLYWLRFI